MAEIVFVAPSILRVHPRNQEFFDDIQGEALERFKESIKNDGILSALLVAPDMTVISGHQRLKAAIELGLQKIPIVIKQDAESDEDKTRLLLAANFGRLKNDPIKQAKVFKEYETLRGVQSGSGRPLKNGDYPRFITQDEIAKELGVDASTLRAIKRLSNLDPDLQELISSGKVTPTTGIKLITKLSIEEQAELFASLPKDVKLSQKEVQDSIKELKARIKEQSEDMQEMTERIAEKREEANREIKKRNATIKSMEAEIAAKVEEVEAKKAEAAKLKAILDDENRDAAGEYIFKVDELQVKLRAEQEKRAQEKAEHNKERKEAQKKLDNLAIETKKYITERDNYNNQLKSLNAELEEAKARAAAADPLLVEQYRQLVVDKENEVADMKDKIATLEKQTQFRTPLDMFRVFDLVTDMLYAYANSGTIKEMANNSDEFINRLGESADRISDAAEMIRNIRGTNCEMRAI